MIKRIFIKNLLNEYIELYDIKNDLTVLELKKIITSNEKYNNFDIDKFRLIYNNVELKNNNTIEDYNISENFVLILISKIFNL